MKNIQNTAPINDGKERLFSLDFVSSTVANFANAIGLSMLLATLPLYVTFLGGNNTDAGLVAGAAQLTALLFRPFVGWLTDAWCRRPVVLIGISCYGAASMVYLLASAIPSLLVGRMVHGFGASCYTTSANVYVADIAPANRRAEAMGFFSAAQAIGIMVGPVIGFYIIEVAGYHNMFYFTGTTAAVAFLISLLAREKRQTTTLKPHSWSLRTGIVATDALPIAWMALCMGMGFGTVNAFISIFAQPRGVANPGFYFTVQAVALVLSRTFAGQIADRYGRAATIIPGILLMTIALATLPLAYGYQSFLISASLFGLGFGAAQPATMAMLIDRIRFEQRGLATSTYYIGFDLGLSMGSILMGMVCQQLGFGVMWLVASTITILSLAGLLKDRRC
jgi:MFS family permease